MNNELTFVLWGVKSVYLLRKSRELESKPFSEWLPISPYPNDRSCRWQMALADLFASIAVTAFARTVGETHALSRADLHLIALAHSLHTHLHGESSLNKEPEPARPVTRGKHNSRGMPGWGAVGGRWEDMDRMEEAEKAALEQAQGMIPLDMISTDPYCTKDILCDSRHVGVGMFTPNTHVSILFYSSS